MINLATIIYSISFILKDFIVEMGMLCRPIRLHMTGTARRYSITAAAFAEPFSTCSPIRSGARLAIPVRRLS
jgi:hypothetical protein